MKKITIILFLSFAIMSLVATNVYIWQNENETAHYPDPDTGEPLYAAEGISGLTGNCIIICPACVMVFCEGLAWKLCS